MKTGSVLLIGQKYSAVCIPSSRQGRAQRSWRHGTEQRSAGMSGCRIAVRVRVVWSLWRQSARYI